VSPADTEFIAWSLASAIAKSPGVDAAANKLEQLGESKAQRMSAMAQRGAFGREPRPRPKLRAQPTKDRQAEAG